MAVVITIAVAITIAVGGTGPGRAASDGSLHRRKGRHDREEQQDPNADRRGTKSRRRRRPHGSCRQIIVAQKNLYTSLDLKRSQNPRKITHVWRVSNTICMLFELIFLKIFGTQKTKAKKKEASPDGERF